ncbi:MAG: PfkB family carbohydrate kinase [Treponema sp.]|jgi:sugar/nucleoside kinase (ribokinase family)|nr:PfkB family carbohydrate kinase [Treponema sp.]
MMSAPGPEQFDAILEALPSLRIAVAGDLFLDKWLEIDRNLDEPSVETGLTAYQVVNKRLYAGAAGTVLSNFAALDVGKLYAVSFTGDDGEGFELRRILSRLGVNLDGVVVSGGLMTPTYTKPLFLKSGGGFEESNRLDHRNAALTSPEIEGRIIASLRALASAVDAVVVVDQLTVEGYGVITPGVREALAEIAAENKRLVVYADSRAFISKFKNTIIKCNDHEAVAIVKGKTVPLNELVDLDEAGSCLPELSKQSGKEAFISCGSRGVLFRGKDGKPELAPAIPVPPPIDIVGAGDACTSGIVAALCCGASPGEAAFMGNLCSSITIQVIGSTGTADREQLRRRYKER